MLNAGHVARRPCKRRRATPCQRAKGSMSSRASLPSAVAAWNPIAVRRSMRAARRGLRRPVPPRRRPPWCAQPSPRRTLWKTALWTNQICPTSAASILQGTGECAVHGAKLQALCSFLGSIVANTTLCLDSPAEAQSRLPGSAEDMKAALPAGFHVTIVGGVITFGFTANCVFTVLTVRITYRRPFCKTFLFHWHSIRTLPRGATAPKGVTATPGASSGAASATPMVCATGASLMAKPQWSSSAGTLPRRDSPVILSPSVLCSPLPLSASASAFAYTLVLPFCASLCLEVSVTDFNLGLVLISDLGLNLDLGLQEIPFGPSLVLVRELCCSTSRN